MTNNNNNLSALRTTSLKATRLTKSPPPSIADPFVSGDWLSAIKWIERGRKLSSVMSSLESDALNSQITIGDAPSGSGLWGVSLGRSDPAWEHWNKLRGMTKDDAMRKYVDMVTAASPGWRGAESRLSNTPF